MITRVLRLLIMLCPALTCSLPAAIGQLDTEFWFVAPEVWDGHGDDPILLRFSTLGEPAEVTVELPANPTFTVQTLNIAANGTQTLDLTPWLGDIENKPFNTILDKGLRITSDAPVTAYYEINHPNNPDIFALKGASALGEIFFVPFQNYLDNVYEQSTASIDIVAIEDGTEITVTPTAALTGYPAGVPFVIELNQGETYALRAASVLAASHPSGTLIQSSAPIAVTISDDSLLGAPFNPSGCYDIMGDQVIPVELAGKEYIAIKGNLGGPDKVFIVGTEDNTSISINGTNVWTVDAGETYAHTLSAPAAFYETSAPVVALHMTGFGCEVGGAILPPIACTGSDEVAFVRSSSDFIGMKIIVPSGAEGDFTFNGNAGNISAVNFSDVPGTGGEWMYANITATGFVPTGGASRLTNGTAKFHLGIINGGASSGTRYGYFSDFSNYEHSTFTSDNELCAGETAELFASPILEASYEWIGPNGFEAEGDEITIGPLTLEDAGLYVVSGMAGECEILPDTLELFVAPQPPVPDVVPIDTLCEGDDWSFTSLTPADNWIWEDAEGNLIFAGDSTASYSNADTSDAGEYTLVIEAESCPSEPTMFELVVMPNVSSAFSLIPEYCLDHDPATAVADESGGDWSASCVNCISTAGQFSPATAGTGMHTITYTIPGGCGTTTDATVTVHALPDADFTYAPAEGCAPALIECSAPVNPSIVDCQWTYNTNGVGESMDCEENLFVIENPGCYLMSHTVLDNNGCTNTAAAEELLCLGAPPTSAFNLSPAQASIFDTNIEAWASDSIPTNTYTWHVDETLMGQGTYQSFSIPDIGLDLFQLCLEAEDSLGCSSLTCAVIDLTEGLNAFAPNAFTPDNDGQNDAWRMYISGAVTRFELHIYDRWGSLVFASEDPEAQWVGDVQGGDHFAPDGVYHYEAVLRDDAYAIKTLQGHILLIR